MKPQKNCQIMNLVKAIQAIAANNFVNLDFIRSIRFAEQENLSCSSVEYWMGGDTMHTAEFNEAGEIVYNSYRDKALA